MRLFQVIKSLAPQELYSTTNIHSVPVVTSNRQMEQLLVTTCIIFASLVHLSANENVDASSNQQQQLKLNLPTPPVIHGNKSHAELISPFNVGVTFVVEDLSSIKPHDMDFRMDFLVAYNWSIEYDSCISSLADWLSSTKHPGKNNKQVTQDPNSIATGDVYQLSGTDGSWYFWTPDTIFMDVKKIDSPNGVAGSTLLSVTVASQSHCNLLLETSLTGTIPCSFSFRLSPYDQQICSFRMRSHSYPLPHLKFNWSSKGVVTGRDYHLHLNHYEAYFKYNHTTWQNAQINPSKPTYSVLQITFRFDRKISNFAVSIVIPTILMVIVAYSSFWISVESGPGRFLLTVLTLLALVTQFSGIRNQLPPVSYASAGDVWLITCMMFVFGAIIELAVVNFLDKRRKQQMAAEKAFKEASEKKEATKVKELREKFNKDLESGYSSVRLTPSIIKALDADPSEQSPEKGFNCSRLRPFGKWTPGQILTFESDDKKSQLEQFGARSSSIDLALRIDVVSRIVYPLLFAIFNIIYWPLLLTRSL